MSKTRFKIVRDSRKFLRKFPRNLIKEFLGNHLAIRRYLSKGYDMEIYDKPTHLYAWHWIEGFLDKHEGEEWSEVESKIISRLKEERVSPHRINLFFKWLKASSHPHLYLQGEPKYIVNSSGILHFNDIDSKMIYIKGI
jgi:hypothetical protein